MQAMAITRTRVVGPRPADEPGTGDDKGKLPKEGVWLIPRPEASRLFLDDLLAHRPQQAEPFVLFPLPDVILLQRRLECLHQGVEVRVADAEPLVGVLHGLAAVLLRAAGRLAELFHQLALQPGDVALAEVLLVDFADAV